MTTHVRGLGYTLLTGATGFIGHVLTAELLRRGHRCAILVRPPVAAATRTLCTLLGELGLDADRLIREGRLIVLRGSLPDDLPEELAFSIARLVHAAASIRFEPDSSGEPARTNDTGTHRLLQWAQQKNIRELHLISTAFVGGLSPAPLPERELPMPTAFRNTYERTKWHAEQHACHWAARVAGSCTIYRPSVVVGDHTTGRASRFNGAYLAIRAYARHATRDNAARAEGRSPSGLRIPGRRECRLNIVPVDHISLAIARIIDSPAHHGRVYNLVDPSPPTGRMLLDAAQRAFGAIDSRFIDPSSMTSADLNESDRSFASSIRALLPYLACAQEFERANTAAFESAAALPWPTWDAEALQRLMLAARRRNPESDMNDKPVESPHEQVATYFERFLPDRLGGSGMADMRELTTTFRFVVNDIPDGEWVCRFHEGRLAAVRRGINGVHEEFAFRMHSPVFWDIVSARVDPQDVFFQGRAEVSGNIELALKMGMILQQFMREHPYTPAPSTKLAEIKHGR